MLNQSELDELQELRRFKKQHDTNALNRAFARLDALMDAPFQQKSDTVMSVRAFRALAEALICLRDEVLK